MSGGWFSLRQYDNHRFIDDFPKSSKGWHISWLIATNPYDVAYHELSATSIEFVPSGELSMKIQLTLLELLNCFALFC